MGWACLQAIAPMRINHTLPNLHFLPRLHLCASPGELEPPGGGGKRRSGM